MLNKTLFIICRAINSTKTMTTFMATWMA